MHREANLNSQELPLLVKMVVKLKRRTAVEGDHGAMVLDKLPMLGLSTIWFTVGQGPTALAVDAGVGCLDIFTLVHHFSPLSPSLWETARYRLKYCLKGPLKPKKPTNQHIHVNLEIRVYVQGRNLAILFSTKANT